MTLRDLAVDLGAAVLVVVTAESGHPQPHRADPGIPCRDRDFVRRIGDRQLAGAARPCRRGSNREALARLAPVRAALPAGAGSLDAADFAAMSARGVRPRLGARAGRAEAWSTRSSWSSTTTPSPRSAGSGTTWPPPGCPARPPASRPHVTLAVAERIDPRRRRRAAPVADRLPLDCALGAPLIFGRSDGVLARLVVPTAELLALHARGAPTVSAASGPGPDGPRAARPVDGARHAGPSGRRRTGWAGLNASPAEPTSTAASSGCGAGTATPAPNTRSPAALADADFRPAPPTRRSAASSPKLNAPPGSRRRNRLIVRQRPAASHCSRDCSSAVKPST